MEKTDSTEGGRPEAGAETDYFKLGRFAKPTIFNVTGPNRLICEESVTSRYLVVCPLGDRNTIYLVAASAGGTVRLQRPGEA